MFNGSCRDLNWLDFFNALVYLCVYNLCIKRRNEQTERFYLPVIFYLCGLFHVYFRRFCCHCCCCFLCSFIGSGQFWIVDLVTWLSFLFLFTFVTCCVELPDFCASRDCCCVWVFAAADDDIMSHIGSDVFAANALVVFDDVSHLSGAFNWPSSDEAKDDRFTDDIEKNARWQAIGSNWQYKIDCFAIGPVHLCRMGVQMSLW